MRPIVIALTGPAGSGKSTVAEHLVREYGAKRYSLAAPLKEIAKRTLNFADEQLYGTQEQKEAVDPRYGFSARWFLQRLGTEGCRAVLGTDIWSNACLRQIVEDAPVLAVIDDMRFIDEAENLHFNTELDGRVWRLHPPADDEASVRLVGAGTHESEQEWLHLDADVEIRLAYRGVPALISAADRNMPDRR